MRRFQIHLEFGRPPQDMEPPELSHSLEFHRERLVRQDLGLPLDHCWVDMIPLPVVQMIRSALIYPLVGQTEVVRLSVEAQAWFLLLAGFHLVHRN